MAVALDFERMAQGWVRDNSTIRAVYQLASDLSERVGKRLEVPTVRTEFDAFVASLGGKAERTRARYAQIIRGFLASLGRAADCNLIALQSRDLEQFLDERRAAGISATAVAFELKLIRSVLRRAMSAGRLQKNVAADVTTPEGTSAVREVFEVKHVRALLMACRRHIRGRDWRGAILTLFYTGARLGDVANLKWSNVDFDERLLQFIPRKTKRHAGEIKLPLHPQLEAHLLKMSAPDAPDAFLFPSLAGRDTGGAHGLSSEFAGLMADAGIERRALREASGKGRTVHNFGAHSFRHAFATLLARAGVSEQVRMRLTGHETKDIHRRYSHLEIEQLRAAVAMLPEIAE